MDFSLTEEQRILRDTARAFLEAECPSAFVLKMEDDPIGFTPELWRKMADLGWMGLLTPDQYGGIGGGLPDLVVMMEEMGRACLPGPFFSTIVLGATALMAGGSDKQKAAFLPRIATGELKLTLAYLEPAAMRYDPYLIETTAAPQGEHYAVNGTKLFVTDAHVADHIIVAARTSGERASKKGISLFIVGAKTPGVNVVPLKTFAGDKQFEVTLEAVKVTSEQMLGPLDGGGPFLEAILERASICKCAEMVGGAQKVLDMASAYTKEREQFGRPIGSFQAVQHHCANMLIAIQGSRHITYKTAWMLGQGIPCTKDVSIAKAWVSDAYKRVVGLGHQVQGATAYMIEHDMPLYSRRAKVAEMEFGDAGYHRRLVAEQLGL
jgi:alkylation response protein AidB-like acyl-CoA dehydrogenase